MPAYFVKKRKQILTYGLAIKEERIIIQYLFRSSKVLGGIACIVWGVVHSMAGTEVTTPRGPRVSILYSEITSTDK